MSAYRLTVLVGSLLVAALGGASTAWAAQDPACASSPDDAADIALVIAWIQSLQYGDAAELARGALRVHHDPGLYDAAGPYFDVTPYRANLGLIGLLRTSAPGRLAAVERWIGWYLAHLHADGTIFDHWYRADGSGQTTCPEGPGSPTCDYQDSADSTAATLLDLAWAYYQAGGSPAFLQSHRGGLTRVAEMILALQDGDGLTWARASHPVKLTMNNSEVHAGLASMARLASTVFGDRSAARRYGDAARRIRDAVRTLLYDQATGLYRVARFADGSVQGADLRVWYPGTVAVTWPHLFEVTSASGPVARAQMAAVDAAWDDGSGGDWTSTVVDPAGFLWPAVGHAAQLTGDCRRARAHLALVKALRFPRFPYPFTVDDGGWVLRTLTGFAGGP